MDGITNSITMNLSKFWEMVKDRVGWLAACSPWDHKDSDTSELLNNTKEGNK